MFITVLPELTKTEIFLFGLSILASVCFFAAAIAREMQENNDDN